MDSLSSSKALFQQLADTDGAEAVHVLIENHDAWSHQDLIALAASPIVNAQLQRLPQLVADSVVSEVARRRIHDQRERLASLLHDLPVRYSTAG